MERSCEEAWFNKLNAQGVALFIIGKESHFSELADA